MNPNIERSNPPPLPASDSPGRPGPSMFVTILIAVLAAAIASVGTGVVVVLLTRRPEAVDRKSTASAPAVAPAQVAARPVLVPDWSHWEFDRKIPFDICKPNYAAFSPSGQAIAISGGDLDERGAWRIVDVATLAVKVTITNPDYGFQAIEFSPDGSSIAVSTFTNTAHNQTIVYDAVTGALKFSVYGSAQAIAFHPTGKYFAISYGGTLWDSLSGRATEGPCKRHHECPAFSPDGKLLYANGGLWELESGKQIGLWSADRGAFSHDSRFLAMPAAVWDLEKQKELWTASIKPGYTARIAFSPDDRLLLVAMHAGKISIHDSATGREINQFEVRNGANSITISPDGRLMATVDRDEGVNLWRSRLREVVPGTGPGTGSSP